MMTSSIQPYPFPKQYNFPPMFTIQPNEATRHAQLCKWSEIVVGYCAHHRLWKLSLSEAVVERPAGTYPSPPVAGADASVPAVPPPRDLFHNQRLDRRLNLEAARQVLAFMTKEGRAQPYNDSAERSMLASLGLGGGSSSSTVDGGGQDTWWIWWRPIQEWANLLDKYIDKTGQRGSVLTVWEISSGEAARGTEFWEMDLEVLRKVLALLVKRGKAQIFGEGDGVGVKFF